MYMYIYMYIFVYTNMLYIHMSIYPYICRATLLSHPFFFQAADNLLPIVRHVIMYIYIWS